MISNCGFSVKVTCRFIQLRRRKKLTKKISDRKTTKYLFLILIWRSYHHESDMIFQGIGMWYNGGGVVNLACKRIFPDKSFLSVLFLYILNLDVCLYVYMFTPDMRGVNMADKNYFRTYNGVIENSRIYITSSSIESA